MTKQETKKVVINRCFGGFRLSKEAFEWLIKNKGWKVTEFNKEGSYKNKNADICKTNWISSEGYCLVKDNDEGRIDSDVIEVVEKLGKKASGSCAELKIVKIPSDVEYKIEEYDGLESIEEVHRSWI